MVRNRKAKITIQLILEPGDEIQSEKDMDREVKYIRESLSKMAAGVISSYLGINGGVWIRSPKEFPEGKEVHIHIRKI